MASTHVADTRDELRRAAMFSDGPTPTMADLQALVDAATPFATTVYETLAKLRDAMRGRLEEHYEPTDGVGTTSYAPFVDPDNKKPLAPTLEQAVVNLEDALARLERATVQVVNAAMEAVSDTNLEDENYKNSYGVPVIEGKIAAMGWTIQRIKEEILPPLQQDWSGIKADAQTHEEIREYRQKLRPLGVRVRSVLEDVDTMVFHLNPTLARALNRRLGGDPDNM
tara:strand:- start:106 stop:780 length:675 start_codon:yes stop_codon:yes gene_type:complete